MHGRACLDRVAAPKCDLVLSTTVVVCRQVDPPTTPYKFAWFFSKKLRRPWNWGSYATMLLLRTYSQSTASHQPSIIAQDGEIARDRNSIVRPRDLSNAVAASPPASKRRQKTTVDNGDCCCPSPKPATLLPRSPLPKLAPRLGRANPQFRVLANVECKDQVVHGSSTAGCVKGANYVNAAQCLRCWRRTRGPSGLPTTARRYFPVLDMSV